MFFSSFWISIHYLYNNTFVITAGPNRSIGMLLNISRLPWPHLIRSQCPVVRFELPDLMTILRFSYRCFFELDDDLRLVLYFSRRQGWIVAHWFTCMIYLYLWKMYLQDYTIQFHCIRTMNLIRTTFHKLAQLCFSVHFNSLWIQILILFVS